MSLILNPTSFDDDVVFVFEGEVLLREEACNLVVDGFDRLIYEINGKVVACYVDGEFCLSGS